jgi:hypothetical protein
MKGGRRGKLDYFILYMEREHGKDLPNTRHSYIF